MRSEEMSLQDAESLQKGDWIVHKQHGVGQIKAIEEKKIGSKIHQYFRVSISDGVYWLPVEKVPDYVRSVSSQNKFHQVLELIGEMPEKLQRDYKERNKTISAQLEDTTLETKGTLIRDLDAWRRLEGVNLSALNERQLISLKKQFLREMTIVFEIEMDRAEEKLRNALEKSFAKLESTAV